MKNQLLTLVIAGSIALPTIAAHGVELDLTTAGSNGTINGAFFTTTFNQSTGTGVIDSFVRLGQSGNNTTAEGYNASARPVMQDVNTSATFTHDLLLSDVPLITIGGIVYYEFLLDINQNGSDPLLSLDKIQIYTRGTALTTANTLAALTAGSTLRYDLDAGSDSTLLLNYNLNSGSGSGDMFAYIPQSVFGATTDYVYLYSAFGNKGGAYAENDGFEEWAVKRVGTTSVPDGGRTVTLLGLALASIGILGLARRRSVV